MFEYLTVSVPVIEPGSPSPPDSVTVEEVTDSTAQLAWSPGRDNGSPITNYLIQTRTPFTVGWQRVNTGRRHLKRNFHLKTHVMVFRKFMDPHREILLFRGVRSATEWRLSCSRELEVIGAAFTWCNLNHFNELYTCPSQNQNHFHLIKPSQVYVDDIQLLFLWGYHKYTWS